MSNEQHHSSHEPKKHDHHLEVSVSTTAGFYPTEGFIIVAAHEKVEKELHHAKEALKIKDTNTWVASVVTPEGKRPVDPSKSFAENGLSGRVEVDWGPSEGGGG